MRIRFLLLALVLLCSTLAAQDNKFYTGTPVKYVFLFIGDGMSSAQRASSDYYRGATGGSRVNNVPDSRMLMNSLPVQGLTTTYSSESIITDSAAAGTAIATGQKTKDGVIGMDPSRTRKLPTIAELAKQAGRKVGIVTSVSLDHATPASFYAHTPGRGEYYEISRQLIESGFDYFGGGQFKGSGEENPHNKPNLILYAKEKGYAVTFGREAMKALQPGKPAIAFANRVDPDAAMPYTLDRREGEATLADFTRKGIELLGGDARGFFLMIEGGKIDWACHANDAKTAITENLALDEAVAVAFAFLKEHPKETLIVVTGDHETGGLTIGFAGTGYRNFPDKLASQKMSYAAFNEQVKQWRDAKTPYEEALPQIVSLFGLGELKDAERAQLKESYERSMLPKKERAETAASFLSYGSYEPLTITCTRILNNQAGLAWTTYSHTGVPVITSAAGAGCEIFGGYYDNTDIFYKLKSILGLRD